MTPTEQDKELADTIFQHLDGLSAVVSINHTTNRKGYAERRKRDGFIVYKTRDELLQLIAADRKRVAIETVRPIVEAFTVKGNRPEYHDFQLRRLETEWPSLYFAIKKLEKETNQ